MRRTSSLRSRIPSPVLAALAAGVMMIHTSGALAASAEEQCWKGRYNAAAKYTACGLKAAAKMFSSSIDFPTYQAKAGKCMAKYTATWPKLQKMALGTGATCDAPRFIDGGNGTVFDNLTGLQWEKKTEDATAHDKGNVYTWSVDPFTAAADGTLFTTFLPTLNGGSCFAGQCDWRMPSQAELQTVLLQPYPCGTSPCIDAIFGPTAPNYYWSGPGFGGLSGGNAVVPLFDDGSLAVFGKTNAFSGRAVRGGF